MNMILLVGAIAVVYGCRPLMGIWALRHKRDRLVYSRGALFVSFVVTGFQLMVMGWLFRGELLSILCGETASVVLIGQCIASVTIVCGLDILCRRLDSANIAHAPNGGSKERFEKQIILQCDSVWFWLYCLVAATSEELLFRGVPLFHALGIVKISIVIIVFSALFAIQHLRNGVSHLGYNYAFGVLFSCLYVMFGSLIPVIIGHAAGNWRILFAARRSRCAQSKDQHLVHSALKM